MTTHGPNNGSFWPHHYVGKVVRFGAFEFKTHAHELRKYGVRIKVQAKPLQILRALIERPGELVTREELSRQLWADGIFVDIESGLNTAANRLRVALGDSAECPRYVETVPRLGYRFICPTLEVSVTTNGHAVPASAA